MKTIEDIDDPRVRSFIDYIRQTEIPDVVKLFLEMLLKEHDPTDVNLGLLLRCSISVFAFSRAQALYASAT